MKNVNLHPVLLVSVAWFLATPGPALGASEFSELRPVVEAEEVVYSYQDADNGAGPLWCSGSTCLVRIGADVFASGLETLKGVPPLNNCRWTLFQRNANGWTLQQADLHGRTREPAPLAGFPGGGLFLSANPTLLTNLQSGGGPAQPQLLEFDPKKADGPFHVLLPQWDGSPAFSEHSYRSFSADGANRELILFQNVDMTHAEWAFRDRNGQWSAHGKLKWPWGGDYAKPQPVRTCYPDVALKNRAVHFCGVSDIVEPNPEWRAFKKQLTGREWDYDFRRLFYTWSDDITTGQFHDWVEIASREKTCGWIFPGDLWLDPDGLVHVLWAERAIDERLRPKFFPTEKQSQSLNYAVLREGKVISRRTLVEAREGESHEIPSAPRFQVTPDNRLCVFYYVQGKNSAGNPVSENRVMEIFKDGNLSKPVTVPLKAPFTSCFTATPRAGSPTSETLEVLGQQAGKSRTMSYARIRLR